MLPRSRRRATEVWYRPASCYRRTRHCIVFVRMLPEMKELQGEVCEDMYIPPKSVYTYGRYMYVCTCRYLGGSWRPKLSRR